MQWRIHRPWEEGGALDLSFKNLKSLGKKGGACDCAIGAYASLYVCLSACPIWPNKIETRQCSHHKRKTCVWAHCRHQIAFSIFILRVEHNAHLTPVLRITWISIRATQGQHVPLNRVPSIKENRGIFFPSGKSGNFGEGQGKSRNIALRLTRFQPWFKCMIQMFAMMFSPRCGRHFKIMYIP